MRCAPAHVKDPQTDKLFQRSMLFQKGACCALVPPCPAFPASNPDLQKSGMQPGFSFYPPGILRCFVQIPKSSYNKRRHLKSQKDQLQLQLHLKQSII